MENNKRRSIKNLREILKKLKRYEPKHYKKNGEEYKGHHFKEYVEKQKYQEQNLNSSISEMNEEKPEMTAEEEKSEMVAEEEKTEMVAGKEKPETTAGEEKPEMTAEEEKPETTAREEKPEMVAEKEKPEMIVGEEKIILEKDMSEETLELAEKIYLPRPNTFEKEFPRLSRIFPRLSISRFGVSLLKFKLRLKRARKSHKNIEEKTEIGYYDKEEAKQKYKEKFKVDGLEKSSICNKIEKEQEHLNYEKDDNEER